jgi:hypothetical protein
MPVNKQRCAQCRRSFVPNTRGRPRRFCRPACRQAAARKRRAGYLWYLSQPKSRCGYCRRPLPKGRTRRRLYCGPSCAQMAYLRRKFHGTYPIRVLLADFKAQQRRAEAAAQVERQVNQALDETRDR